jgi:hypothetical protein
LLTSSNPTGGADAWSTTTLAQTLTALSCPTTTLCVAGDEGGQLYVTDNPTGGAGAWPHALVAATPCTFTTGCIEEHVVAADDTGVNRLDTTVGAGHSLTNVALGPDSVTWLHDGVPRQVPLR